MAFDIDSVIDFKISELLFKKILDKYVKIYIKKNL